MEKKPSLFEQIGPAKSFGLGIVLTLLIIFSAGFFILLFGGGMSFGGGNTDKALADFNKPAANTGTNTNPTQPTTQINMKAVTSDDHIRGNVNTAQAIIVEFSDLDCPYCKQFHPTMEQIMADYDGQVAWVYRHFPLDSLHPQARSKAEASECVYELGGNTAFWNFIDKVYAETTDDLPAFAAAAGVDKSKFNDCVAAGKYKDKVEADYQDAVSSGGRGTPYSVVLTKDGQRIPISGALPIENIKSVLDPLLAKQ